MNNRIVIGIKIVLVLALLLIAWLRPNNGFITYKLTIFIVVIGLISPFYYKIYKFIKNKYL